MIEPSLPPDAGDLPALLAASESARIHGAPRKGAEWAAAAARVAEACADPVSQARALTQLALHQVRLGELEQAAASGQQALARLSATGPSTELARAHGVLSLAYERAGLNALAVSEAAAALDLAHQLADPREECMALIRLGTAADETDDQRGLSLLEQAIDLARRLPGPDVEALFTALNNRSRRWVVEADRRSGDRDASTAALQAALPLVEEAARWATPGFAAATAAANLGGVHRRLGHAGEARAHFGAALAAAQQHGYGGLAATVRLALASMDVELDPGPAQRQALAQLLDDPRKGVDPDLALQARRTLVQGCRAGGDPQAALQQLECLHAETLTAFRRRADLQSRLLFNHAALSQARHTAELERVRADAEQQKAQRLALDRDQLEQEVAARTAELRRATRMAEAASRAKSTFLSIVSHELRTPLNGLIGMVELARRRAVDPRQASQLADAATAARRLGELVGSILDFVDADSAPPAAASEVDLPALLGAQADAARGRGLDLTLHCSPDLPPVLRLDGARLSRILSALLDNAVKFSSPGPVRLHADWRPPASGPGWLRLVLSDSGPGLAPELVQRLFRPFEPGDGSTTRTQGGLGLGLALAYRLAQSLGGELGVDPHPSGGSCFWVRLPVLSPPAAPSG